MVRFFGSDGMMITGTFTARYDSGAIRFTCECTNGIKNGRYNWYYPEGVLGITCNFINGKIHGIYDSYSMDGSHIYSTMYYENLNLDIDPRSISAGLKFHIMMTGRIPKFE